MHGAVGEARRAVQVREAFRQVELDEESGEFLVRFDRFADAFVQRLEVVVAIDEALVRQAAVPVARNVVVDLVLARDQALPVGECQRQVALDPSSHAEGLKAAGRIGEPLVGHHVAGEEQPLLRHEDEDVTGRGGAAVFTTSSFILLSSGATLVGDDLAILVDAVAGGVIAVLVRVDQVDEILAAEFPRDHLAELLVEVGDLGRVDDDDSLLGAQGRHRRGRDVVADPETNGVVTQMLHVQRKAVERFPCGCNGTVGSPANSGPNDSLIRTVPRRQAGLP